MSASASIKKVGIKHAAMVDWMIENPCASRTEMAGAFGVSVSWLSTIIHSDAFQAELKRHKEKVFNSAIARPIQEKLIGAAHIAVERLQSALHLETDTRNLVAAAEMLTKAAGEYKGEKNKGLNGGGVHVERMLVVSPDELARARSLIGRVPGGEIVDGELARADTAQLSALRPAGMGAESGRAALPAGDEDAHQALQEGAHV